jgi:hypothetical protein
MSPNRLPKPALLSNAAGRADISALVARANANR